MTKPNHAGAVTPSSSFQPSLFFARVEMIDQVRLPCGAMLPIWAALRLRDQEVTDAALRMFIDQHAEAPSDLRRRENEKARPLVPARDPEPLTALAFAGIAAIAWALLQLLSLFT